MTRRMSWRAGARITAGLLAAVIAGSAAVLAEEREEALEKRVSLDGAKQVVVKNVRGDVRIAGERDRDDVRCQFLKQARGRKREEVDRVFAAMDVEITRNGNDIVIEAIYPKRRESDRGLLALIMQQYTNMRVDLDISVPAAIAVGVAAGSGDVAVADIGGAVEISAASGDIDVRRLGASLEIQVSSGDIIVEDAAGPITLATASGGIDAVRVRGDASLRSASGDITASDIGGNVACVSTSGDVSVAGVGSVEFGGTSGSAIFTDVRGGVTAGTASGDIEIAAAPQGPANFSITSSSGEIVLTFVGAMPGGFALKAQTTVGEISVRLPIELHKINRRYLSGVVREGKSVVAIESSSGDIVITESGE